MGMKFIRVIGGEYINVNTVKKISVGYDASNEYQWYISADIVDENDEDANLVGYFVAEFENEQAAQAALDELMTKINGDEG